MNIGKAIKLCRVQYGMTQAKLSNLAGISTAYLCLLEQGKRDVTFDTLTRIAVSLQISIVLLTFLALENEEEFLGITEELAGKISFAALQTLKSSEV